MILKMIEWTIPFILGLCSTLIVDKLRFARKKRKVKHFILIYLENLLNSDLPKLKDEYEKLKLYINEADSREKYKMLAFEGFNENILNGITPVDYYDIYQDDFIVLNDIKSIIGFLSEHLPDKIMLDYFDFINQHLKEKSIIGDVKHLETCQTCIDKKEEANLMIDSRLDEVDILINKIRKFKKTVANIS